MSNKAKVVVNEEKISETPTVLVGASDKADQLSPNPAHSGFTKQLFVDSLPGTGEPNVIYIVAQKTGPEQAIVGYKNYKWDLEQKKYVRVFDNDPALKILQGPQGVEVNEVNAPKKAPEKVYEGEVIFKEEPIIKGKKLSKFVDVNGGVSEEELETAINDVKVTPNPELAGTEESLTSVQIGNTKYKVPQPTPELPTAPTTDGEYTLKCTVVSGVATYSWVAVE